MKNLLTLPLIGLLTATPDTQRDPYCMNHPTWDGKMLIVAEYDVDDADTHWEVVFNESKLEELRTDTGEVIKPGMFTPELVGPGDVDPRVRGVKKLAAGQRIMVWEFSRPKQEWKSLERLAGSYMLTHGGYEQWLDVPMDDEADAEPVSWENEHLEAAGLHLKRGIRTVQQLHVRAKVDSFEFDRFILLDAAGEQVSSRGSGGKFSTRTEHWEMGEHDLSELKLVARFDDGTELVVDELPDGPKFQRVKGSEWRKKKMSLEIALLPIRETYTEGSYTGYESGGPEGSLKVYRRYRWVDKRGRELDIFPLSEAGGIRSFTSSCPIVVDAPKGARLQLGFLVGARSERVEFEHTNLPAPK